MIINILAFNLGKSKGSGFCNGPGNSLLSLLQSIPLKSDIKIKLFLQMPTEEIIPGIEIYNIQDFFPLKRDEIIHWWSGTTRPFLFKASKFINNPCIIGPNLLDGTDFVIEKSIINLFKNAKYITLNNQLKFSLSKEYNIPLYNIDIFKSGPNVSLWQPPDKYEKFILWKGAGGQAVKDLQFAKDVRDAMPQYKFVMLGENERYDYIGHIDLAKKAWLYFSTSVSETMGMTLLEQWSAGVPSVTHPKIMLHGINYETGIVTSRDVKSYCDSIEEIMHDDNLRNYLSNGARKYILDNFSNKKISEQYLEILKNAS